MFATFGDDRLRGLGVARSRFSGFSIDLRRCPYNTLALPGECVIRKSETQIKVHRIVMKILGPVSPLFILLSVLISDVSYVY